MGRAASAGTSATANFEANVGENATLYSTLLRITNQEVPFGACPP